MPINSKQMRLITRRLLLLFSLMIVVACTQPNPPTKPLPTAIPTLDVAQFNNLARYAANNLLNNASADVQPLAAHQLIKAVDAVEIDTSGNIETLNIELEDTKPANREMGSVSGTSTNRLSSTRGDTPLQVTSTHPRGGSFEVSTDGQIIVVFNRPVVPLVGMDELANLIQPLTFDPPVEGLGEWINTSIYAFQPSKGLAGATNYQITVADVAALDGSQLQEAYQFTFTTAAPMVINVQSKVMENGNAVSTAPLLDALSLDEPSIHSGIETVISPHSLLDIQFSQSMNPESSEAAVQLALNDGNSLTPVEVEFSWNDSHTTLTIEPERPLDFGALYTIEIQEDAQPANGQGALRKGYANRFAVVPLPKLQWTLPNNGATNVPPDSNVTLQFNAPISPTSALANIHLSPPLSNTQLYSYYLPYNQELILDWQKQPNSQYTITIGAEIVDDYGNSLEEPSSLTFTTGNYHAFTRIELEQVTHFSAYTQSVVGLLYRNVEQLNVRLYQLPLQEFYKLTGDQQWQYWGEEGYLIPDPAENLLWDRAYEATVEQNITGRQRISLTDELGELLSPGIYLLEAEYPANSGLLQQRNLQNLIVLSNHNLIFKESQDGPSIAWLTDLRTGQPVEGQEVHVAVQEGLLTAGTTDADGIARLDLSNLEQFEFSVNSQSAKTALSGLPGDKNFAIVNSRWSNGIGSWDFNLPFGFGTQSYQMHFYTERPIYRPGQTIHWKGMIRALVDDGYRLPSMDIPVEIAIRDDRGNMIAEEAHLPNQYGTVHGQVTLSPEAVSGFYYLEARLPLEEPTSFEQDAYGGVGIQVAAYRTPEFEISVVADQPDYLHGDTIQATVQASYFSGGPLSNAPVTWRILAEPYHFSWAENDSDNFRNSFFSFTPYDPEQGTYDPYATFSGGLIAEGTGKTDADGRLLLELSADLGGALQSQRWSLDVTVQSATNQFVSGQVSLPIHRGAFYIGLNPQQYVVQAGEESATDVVTVTPQGEPYPNTKLEATVYAFEWNSVYAKSAEDGYYWESSVERTPVYSTTVATDQAGTGTVNWTPESSGQYQIVVHGEDEAGNPIHSATFLWVSANEGSSFIAWPRSNNDRIELVADKALYQPGETAKILIPSPFTGPIQTLVTVERGGILSQEVMTLNGNSETLEIPITAEHLPNIFVSIILVKGIDESNPTPAMRMGYLQLNVDISEKELAIQIEPSAEEVRPSDRVSYTLTIVDSQGQPTPNTEVSVALVDKAVLSLTNSDARSLLDIFYYERSLGVNTSALLTINQDRLSQQLSEGSKGGGGGGLGDMMQLRQEFSDVAFWQADLVTDEQGQITFAVDLPDNLTTWQLVALAINDETLVGNGTNEIVATKALQIRPLLPRFFTAGDQATIGAALMNHSELDLTDGLIDISLQGATLVDGAKEAQSAEFALAGGDQLRLDYPIIIDPSSREVVLTFTAQAQNQTGDQSPRDALSLTLPVYRYETPETVATAGTVSAEGALEALFIPENATDSGELIVTLEPSLAAGMIDGLDYLQHYPYECNEQSVSRFLPNLFTAQALGTLGIQNAALADNLENELAVGTQRLINRQNPDGGWGYWANEMSNPFITAYVLWGLWHASEMAHPVPELTINSAIAYLERSFVAPKDVTENWLLNQMAFTHFVLAEMGEGDPGRISTLFDERERLALYGHAYLAMAMATVQPDDTRVQTLLDTVLMQAQSSATGTFWHEKETDWRTLNTDTRTTSIILAAFSRLEPEQPMLPQVVRWLMSARQAGRWSNTQENAWAIIALTDWLESSGELKADYAWQVTLNEDEWGVGDVNAENLNDKIELRSAISELLREEANLIQLKRSNDSGNLYYTTHLRYYLDAQDIEARDRGIVVDRQFEVDGEASDSAQVGDVISVTVTLVAPTDLHQVLVEIPIPAGTEPIDASLNTTSEQFTGPEFDPVDRPNGPNRWWSYWQPTYTNIRDEKVALVATYLAAGTYEYTFQLRATVPGEYKVLPVYAEQIYFNEVWGRSGGGGFEIRP